VWNKGWQTFFAHDHLTQLQQRRYIEELIDSEDEKPYQGYLDVMRSATGEGGFLSHVDRTFVVDTGKPEFMGMGFPRRSFVEKYGSPMKILEDLNTAWGGSLMVDGIICYRNGDPVDTVFEEGRNGEELFYSADVRIYRQVFHFSNMFELSIEEMNEKMVNSPKFSSEVDTLWQNYVESPEFDASKDSWLNWLSISDEELAKLGG
jgi:hypothetical protein